MNAGGIDLLMTALQTNKQRARSVFLMLCYTTATSHVSEEQVRSVQAKVAGRHGVHHLCKMLCPTIISGDLVSWGRLAWLCNPM